MYMHTLITHAHTLYPFEHIQENASKKLIRRVLRLTKSPLAPQCHRERRIPQKNIPPFLRHQSVKSGGATALLTIQTQVGSQ